MKNLIILFMIFPILEGCHEIEKHPELIKDSEQFIEKITEDIEAQQPSQTLHK